MGRHSFQVLLVTLEFPYTALSLFYLWLVSSWLFIGKQETALIVTGKKSSEVNCFVVNSLGL